MPNLKSAQKALRKSKKRTIRNKAVKNKIKLLTKRTRKNAQAKQIDQAQDYLHQAQKALDKAAKVGIIKKNTANRTKSRLAKIVNAAGK